MKIISAILLLLLISAAPAFGQWKRDGEFVGDIPNRKAVGGFGAHLVLIKKKPDDFVKEWLKSKPPNIKPVSEAKRGEIISALVFFAGCMPGFDEKCNSKVDYTVYKPDGSVLHEQKGLVLWQSKPPPEQNIQLSRAMLWLRFEKGDPAGEYKIKARVHDVNADISFEIETKVNLKK